MIETFECKCGSKIKKTSLRVHVKTKKHLNFVGNVEILGKKLNNETFGMSIEREICEIFNISHKISPLRTRNISENIKYDILDILKKNNITPVEHIGGLNGSIDFLCKNGKTLSVKTNTNGFKICPQIIGQSTVEKFGSYFNLKSLTKPDIKQWILNHPVILFKEYFKHTFSCDYLLWVFKDSGMDRVMILNSNLKYKYLKNEDFSFTRSSNWNESSTLKYLNTSIGEFQIHSNRNCVKFRFNLKNMLSALCI
jgi:hypothetical protein